MKREITSNFIKDEDMEDDDIHPDTHHPEDDGFIEPDDKCTDSRLVSFPLFNTGPDSYSCH